MTVLMEQAVTDLTTATTDLLNEVVLQKDALQSKVDETAALIPVVEQIAADVTASVGLVASNTAFSVPDIAVALLDELGNVGVSFAYDGSMTLADATITPAEIKQLLIDSVTTALLRSTVDADTYGTGSGYMVAVKDDNEHVGFAITNDSTMHLGSTTITPAELESAKLGGTLVQPVAQNSADIKALKRSRNIITIGDSITHGLLHDGAANPVGLNDSSLTKAWPDLLNDDLLLARTTINRGWSGHTSEHAAAAAKALGTLITLPGNTIPADRLGDVITDPATWVNGVEATAVNGAAFGAISNVGMRQFTGTLSGIRGHLSVWFTTGGVVARTWFVRDTVGVDVVIQPKTPFIYDEPNNGSGLVDSNGIGVIMIGINNFFGSNPTTYTDWPGRVMSDIRALADLFQRNSGQFVVMTIPAVPVVGTGLTAAESVLLRAVNAEILTTYPDNSIDLHAALVASAEINPPGPAWSAPNYLDPVDAGNDETPRSCTYDGVHFNDKGASIAYNLVRDFIIIKGW